jgi:hypothetical protein
MCHPTLVHILHRYSLGDVFVAKSWTNDDRGVLFDIVDISSHSSALISLANPDDWVWLLFFFFSATILGWLVLPRARPLRVIVDTDVDGFVDTDVDGFVNTDVDGFVVRVRADASAGRDIFLILVLNARNNWCDDIKRPLIATYNG